MGGGQEQLGLPPCHVKVAFLSIFCCEYSVGHVVVRHVYMGNITAHAKIMIQFGLSIVPLFL